MTLMREDDGGIRWKNLPVYLTDDGNLQCNMPGDCDGDPFKTIGPGRRFVMGELMDALADHAKFVHSLPVYGR